MFDYSIFDENKGVKRSKDYAVNINGKEISVYTCTVSKIPFNAFWPGHQRDINQTETVSFVNLVSDEPISFEITPQRDFSRVMLKPYSKNIKSKIVDKKILFTLKNGFYVLELDNYHKLLYIFNNKYIPCKNRESIAYYFDKGVYDVGTLTLKSNETVYVGKDAYVYGSIFAENSENIHVYGNGIFDESRIERKDSNCFVYGNIKFEHCKNILIEGVGFTNSCSWCVSIFNCFNVKIDNIKVFGQWRYNTDGIDIVNSQNVLVVNSFVQSFDDSIVVKAFDRSINVKGIEDCRTDCKNILVENCVLWCDWGRCLELGFETACKEYTNIIFRNCDILHVDAVALSVHNGDYAEIHDILFEDIRVDYNDFDIKHQLQENDDMSFSNDKVINYPCLFNVCNFRFRQEYSQANYLEEDIKDIEKIAYNHHITAKNVKVHYDKNLPLIDGKYNVSLALFQVVPNTVFDNITVENLYINGEKITEETAYKVGNNSEIIKIK